MDMCDTTQPASPTSYHLANVPPGTGSQWILILKIFSTCTNRIRRFECTNAGIYCYNMRSKSKTKFVFNITTVEGQEQQYSALDVSRAKKARKLQETSIGFRSEWDLLQMIENTLIIGSKVRRRDVVIVNDIYGANTNSLKGKTVRKT